MSAALQTIDQKRANFKDLLQKSHKQVASAIPKHLTPDRMLRIAFSAMNRQPKLFECTQESVISSVIQGAELGLEVNVIGHAYLVPFWNGKKKCYECQLIPGYKGLLKLARNSGDVGAVDARVVRQGDVFEYEFGTNAHLKHIPADDNEDAPVTHAYFIAELKGSRPQFDVMTIGQLNKIRAKSQSKNKEGQLIGPWIDNEEEMQKKTVVRRGCKLLPASAELEKAIAYEERAEAGLPNVSDLLDIGTADIVDGPGELTAKLLNEAPAKGAKKPDAAVFDNANQRETLTESQQAVYDEEYGKLMEEAWDKSDAHAAALKKAGTVK